MLNGICGFRITTLRDREREMREGYKAASVGWGARRSAIDTVNFL